MFWPEYMNFFQKTRPTLKSGAIMQITRSPSLLYLCLNGAG